MTGPMLYQPSQRWRIGAALGVAALIHFAAVAIASIHQHEQIQEAPALPPGIPEVVIEPGFPLDVSTPPPDLVDPRPIPNPTDDSFPDERSTPPPVPRQTTALAAPIVRVRNGVPSGSQSLSSARVSALSAPRPEYPYEARRQKITGNGTVIMTVDSVSGRVTDVVMEESTGSLVLDNAAVTGFRRWRFKPNTTPRVRSPITFIMTGAQY